MQRRSTLVMAAIGVVVLVGLASTFAAFSFQKPDMAAMRTFRLSNLSDENLRDMHAKAEAEVERRRAEYVSIAQEGGARVNAEIADCQLKTDDAAYRARHPGRCGDRSYFTIEDHYARYATFRPRSVDQLFEDMILGPCDSVGTVWEARRVGCLP